MVLLCIVLAALAAIRLADRTTRGRASVLGIVLGLGVATKLSPLPLVVGLGLLGLVLWAEGAILLAVVADGLRRFGLRLGAMPIVAVLTCVAIYPYLWRDPVTHLYSLYAYLTWRLEDQAGNSPAAAGPNRGDAFRRVGHELGDRFSTSGLVAEQLEAWLGRDLPTSLNYLDLVLAVAGPLLLIAMVVRYGLVSAAGMIGALIGGQAPLILLTMEVEYARYLLPIVLLVAVAVGVTVGVARSWFYWARRKRGRDFDVQSADHLDSLIVIASFTPAPGLPRSRIAR